MLDLGGASAIARAAALRFAAIAVVLFATPCAWADAVAPHSTIPPIPLVERALDSGASVEAWGAALAPARAWLALGLLAALGVGWWRPSARDTAVACAALGVVWLAQSFLLSGALGIGAGLYAVGIGSYAACKRSVAPALRWPPALEAAGWALVLGTAVAACGYRLDVYPQLYYDEVAYLKAAQMFLGQLEPGGIFRHDGRDVYSYAQFQSQTVPFLLQGGAIALSAPGVFPLRVASVAAAALTLVVAAAALRRRVGPAVALCMGWLCATAPLFLLYSRTGLYIAITTLHGALCFAATLWLGERWRTGPAVVLGIALGASLYFYQLSWFAPVLSLLALLSSRELRARAGATRVLAIVAVGALGTALPGLVAFRAGIGDVNAQTFDRAVWNRIDETSPRDALVVPEGQGEALSAWTERARAAGLELGATTSVRGQSIVLLRGPERPARVALDEARSAGWRTLDDPWRLDSLWERVPATLAMLLFAANPESAGRWVSGPLLNPIVAPLVVLGIVAALRRRREWPVRALLVWVVGAALLPAAIGGVLPRRAVLIVPFAYALAALALVDVAGRLRDRGRAAKIAAVAGVAAVLLAALLTNAHAYFRTWDERVADYPGAPQVLELAKLLHELPAGETVLIPPMFKGYQMALLRGRGLAPPVRVVEEAGALQPAGIRAASCRQRLPFLWAIPDTPEEAARFGVLANDFALRSETRGGFRLLRVRLRKPNACR